MNPEQESEQFETAINDSGDCYVRNTAAIDEIISRVIEGHYCTIIGPHYCEKSLLLRDVQKQLETIGGAISVLVDLNQFKELADSDFLYNFARLVDRLLREKAIVSDPPAVNQGITEVELQHFFQDYVSSLAQDVVLLIDHLEAIRLGPIESLLRALRATFTTRGNEQHHLTAVTASSLSVAALSLGPISPFNIAHLIWMKDLQPHESEGLIRCVTDRQAVSISAPALRRLIEATGGDRYLIRKLSELCANLASNKENREITEQEVNETLEHLVNDQTNIRQPIRATIRALEDEPLHLMNVLEILREGGMPRRKLRLSLPSEGIVDDLQLTGAVNVDRRQGEKIYLIRNEIYERSLKKHFHPERVAHVLSYAGQWDEAINYLEGFVVKNGEYRSPLLGTIVDAIYARQSGIKACETLARWLSVAFGISKVRFYLRTPDRSHLKLVSQAGWEDASDSDLDIENGNRNEIKAFLSQHYEVFQSDSGERITMVPVVRGDNQPFGLVCLQGFEADPLRDDFLELVAFIKQIGRAVSSIIDREDKLRHLTALFETGKKVTTSLNLEDTMKAAVESAIEAVPGAQRGAFFLWNEEQERLLIGAQSGYRENIRNEIRLGIGQGYVGTVFETSKPIVIEDVRNDPRVLLKDDPDIKKQRSAICVPMEVWGRTIGVLLIDNITAKNVFRESEFDLLFTFVTQATIAIRNARLHTELYNLGIGINRGELDPKEIFQQAVTSITHVSAATAANILLLRDTDDPALSVSQKPLLSASYGLGVDYDEEIKPRADGLTFHVLKQRRAMWVRKPEDPIGINEEASQRGTKAYLCLPLMIQDSIIGVLFVHYNETHDFSDSEINMLSLFANQVALAIENARQREELTMTKAVAWMGLVFSNLAHRITQRAAAIRNTVFALKNAGLADQPEVKERLLSIEENAKAVLQIPGRALLPFEDQAASINLNAVMRDEILRWSKTAGLKVNFKLTEQNTTVFADAKWLAVVVEMLTTNSARAMRDVSQKELNVSSHIRGQRVVIELTNTGREIPEEIRRLLFKKPIPKSKGTGGSGVGLLIARTIMKQYGGDIELTHTSPGHTTFSLWLPLHRNPKK